MKIIVTGGSGFIGSNLIRHLIHHTGHDVLNVDNLTYAGNPKSLADVAGDSRYRFEHLDIARIEAVRNAFAEYRPDWVMHLAAESHVDRSIDGPATFVQTNLLGTFSLLQAGTEYFESLTKERAETFRFLHVSTDEVYGSLGPTGRFTESTAYDPHSPYAATKAGSDHLARAWATTYGLPVIVTNCSNNYGPYQFPEKLIPLMIIKAIGGQHLPVYGDGRHVRDWLFVDDHVRGLCLAMERGVVGQTYNIGGDCERSNIDLVEQLCDLLDALCPRKSGKYRELIRLVSDRPGHDFRYAIDSSKMRSELSWQPEIGFDDGLRRTVRWYLDNRPWWQPILERNYNLGRLGKTDRHNASETD